MKNFPSILSEQCLSSIIRTYFSFSTLFIFSGQRPFFVVPWNLVKSENYRLENLSPEECRNINNPQWEFLKGYFLFLFTQFEKIQLLKKHQSKFKPHQFLQLIPENQNTQHKFNKDIYQFHVTKCKFCLQCNRLKGTQFLPLLDHQLHRFSLALPLSSPYSEWSSFQRKNKKKWEKEFKIKATKVNLWISQSKNK